MFKYYLYFDEGHLEVSERFFKELLVLYSTKFVICKFDKLNKPCCEIDLKSGQSLFYVFHDIDSGRRSYFGKVIYVS